MNGGIGMNTKKAKIRKGRFILAMMIFTLSIFGKYDDSVHAEALPNFPEGIYINKITVWLCKNIPLIPVLRVCTGKIFFFEKSYSYIRFFCGIEIYYRLICYLPTGIVY